MNLYQRALQVNPDQMKRPSGQVIWSGRHGFIYLYRTVTNIVELRWTGREPALIMYEQDESGEWIPATKQAYDEWTKEAQ